MRIERFPGELVYTWGIEKGKVALYKRNPSVMCYSETFNNHKHRAQYINDGEAVLVLGEEECAYHRVLTSKGIGFIAQRYLRSNA